MIRGSARHAAERPSGGHCNGALVAFEMARQLLQSGEHVPAVFMIEAREPSNGAAEDASTAGDAYVTVDGAGLAQVLMPHDRLSDALLRYSRAMDRYAGGACATHVVIVRSRAHDDAGRDPGWTSLAASAETHVLPGDHRTLITNHVGELARVVRAALDRRVERAPS
ncbi:MAG TPA: thioesterase domain-containing protein [Casimicrobiaceae bacterium]|nr:thioesterase domain-containing protein [Casimicrobiaceae bacterium]